DGQQESSSVSSQFVTSMLNPPSDAGMESIFATSSSPMAPLQTSTPIMTSSTIATITTISHEPIPPTTIPSEVLQNLPTFDSVFRFEDRLKSLEANFSEYIQINPFDEAVSNIPVAADLSEMELKKILIEKMEGNKSIQRSDEQRNLYKALVDAYEADKTILDSYGETVILKRRRDEDDDQEEGPSVSASESAFAEEPVQTISQMDEPSYPMFKTGADDQTNKPINYDKHALWGVSHWGRKRQQFYGFAVNWESALDVYSKRRIIAVTDLKIVEWHSYKHLDWITVRRDDDKLYMFKEGDFKRMFTRSIVIQRRMEDLQLGVESYQKRLNLTKPDTDGTLNDVRNALDDRLKGIRIQYLPQTIWRKGDKDKAAAMIQAIDKMLKKRRIMRSLESSFSCFNIPILLLCVCEMTYPSLCFICGSGTHLIKDCNFYKKQMTNTTVGIWVGPAVSPQLVPIGKLKVKPVPTGKPKATPVPTGKPKGTPVPTGQPKVKPVPTCKPKVTPVPTSKPQMFTPVPSGRPNKPFLVATDRGCSPSVISDTEYLVLSKDFKLQDNSMVVLKVFFLEHKDETYLILKNFINLIENQLNKKVKVIRCDNGTEFKNAQMIELCGSKGIKREYSNPRTPHQNKVTERKNRTLIEAARTMLADSKLPTMFWTEAVRTTCYVLNKVSVTSPHNRTPYALRTGNIPSVSHFKPFGCHVTIINTSDHLGKFDEKADEGYIVGYPASNKAYRVYNVPNKRVEESMNLWFLEENPNVQGLDHEWYFDLDYLTDSLGYKHVSANQRAGIQGTTTTSEGTQDVDSDSDCDNKDLQTPPSAQLLPLGRIPVTAGNILVPTGSLLVPTSSIPVPVAATMVPLDDVLDHSSSSTDSIFDDEPTTRFPCPSDLGNHNSSPGIFSSSSYDDEFDTALNNVASTVEALEDLSWVDAMQEEMQQFKFQNVRVLVDLPEGHRQEEGIDYDEVFALVARIEAIRLFLAFTSYMGFLVYQMDVKSAFLYGIIDKEVYVTQPKGFMDPQHPKKVYKVVKALYRLHQAPRAWTTTTPYEAPKPQSKNESDSPVNVHLYRSMIGSLMYLTASRPDIMFAVSACSRHQVTPTTSNLEAVKKIFKYLKGQPKLGLWYPKESP
nr:putative ribonuclease H-like domain-containing protein [Tanacetum cinerariifolium]